MVPRSWSDLPQGKSENTGVEYYGGDLDGVRQHLDHVESLGANGIYFTPLFPGNSTHRYDAVSFDEVDPVLAEMSTFLSSESCPIQRNPFDGRPNNQSLWKEPFLVYQSKRRFKIQGTKIFLLG